jgi:hypothetical protein
MALPTSGVIRFSDINVELGVAANTPRRLSDAAVRTLFAVPSGTIRFSNGFGKSNRISVTVTLDSNTTNYTLGTAQIPGYVAGATDVTLVVNSGVYVYSTDTANAGLTVAALVAGDTVAIVNNGFIIGKGGNGGGSAAATAGGPAMNINRAVTITNNSFIAGGGGGGGRGQGSAYSGRGGGGAGGGSAGNSTASAEPGQPGAFAGFSDSGYGGGRILPGTSANQAGGAGGSSEDSSLETEVFGGAGGLQNNPGQAGIAASGCRSGGGGGGWGAAGGTSVLASGAGGKAVNLNGNTVTWLANGTRWGAIS